MQKTAEKSCILLFLSICTIASRLCSMWYVDFGDITSLNSSLCLGKQKCLSKTGDCLVKHGVAHATGMQLVVR